MSNLNYRFQVRLILKPCFGLGDCFAPPHKSVQVLAMTAKLFTMTFMLLIDFQYIFNTSLLIFSFGLQWCLTRNDVSLFCVSPVNDYTYHDAPSMPFQNQEIASPYRTNLTQVLAKTFQNQEIASPHHTNPHGCLQ